MPRLHHRPLLPDSPRAASMTSKDSPAQHAERPLPEGERPWTLTLGTFSRGRTAACFTGRSSHSASAGAIRNRRSEHRPPPSPTGGPGRRRPQARADPPGGPGGEAGGPRRRAEASAPNPAKSSPTESRINPADAHHTARHSLAPAPPRGTGALLARPKLPQPADGAEANPKDRASRSRWTSLVPSPISKIFASR